MSELAMQYHTFYEHLTDHPEDWRFREEFADWLGMDVGERTFNGIRCEVLAEGQRWQVEHRKRPERYGKSTDWEDHWTWFVINERNASSEPHNVPREVYDQLEATYDSGYQFGRDFLLLQHAEQALAVALARSRGTDPL